MNVADFSGTERCALTLTVSSSQLAGSLSQECEMSPLKSPPFLKVALARATPPPRRQRGFVEHLVGCRELDEGTGERGLIAVIVAAERAVIGARLHACAGHLPTQVEKARA